MDPVTALGLVSSLITIIETGWKAVKLFRDIQQHGTSISNVERDNLAKLISSHTAVLSVSIRDCGEATSKEDREFLQISEDCRALAVSLGLEIQKLRDSKKPAWLLTVATVIKSRKIGEIESQLKKNSALIDSIIVKRLGSQSVLLLRHNDKIDSQMRCVLEAISRGHDTVDELRREMRHDIEKVSDAIIQHQQLTSVEMKDRFEALNLETQGYIAHQHQTTLAEAARTAQLKALLDSLYFPEIFAREQAIKEAEEMSCSFIFRAVMTSNRDVDESGESAFSTWLAQDEPVFWMTGKAGTGKSVIMKYAFRHEETSKRLLRWATESATAVSGAHLSDVSMRVVVLRHFFWKPGSHLQRSMLGLVRSFLWQLLEQQDSIDTTLLKSQLPSQPAVHHVDDWVVSRAVGLFQHALASLPTAVYIYIVIDALDECTDDKIEVQNFLHFLASCPRVKLCLSSRPAEFPVKLPRLVSLNLADINQNAIRATARARLTSFFDLRRREALERQFDTILNCIAGGSQGVFLWAVLVIKEAQMSFEVGDSLEEIRRMIRQDTPKDIADLFQQMIDKIHPRYMDEMSQYFSVISVCQEHIQWPTLLDLFFINQDVWTRFEAQDWAYFSSEAFITKCTTLRSRIEICAAGLLEIPSYSVWPMYHAAENHLEAGLEGSSHPLLQFGRNVTFVHRSVKDVLFTGDGASFIQSIGPAWRQQALLKIINCSCGVLGMLPIFPCSRNIGDSLSLLLGRIENMMLQLQALGQVPENLLPRIYALCQSVSNRLIAAGYKSGEIQFPNRWIPYDEFHSVRLEAFGLPHFAAWMGASQYIAHWIRTASPSRHLLTEVLWYAVMGTMLVAKPDAIHTLLAAGADPNQPCRAIELGISYKPRYYIGIERCLSAWELFLSMGVLPPEHQRAISNSFATHNAQLGTTVLRIQRRRFILRSASFPTFVFETSPVALLSLAHEWQPTWLLMPAELEDIANTKKPARELTKQDALRFVEIRAFGHFNESRAEKAHEDDENNAEEGANAAVNEPAPLDLNAKAGSIHCASSDTSSKPNKAYEFSKGKLYVFNKDESKELMSLMRQYFPDFPNRSIEYRAMQNLQKSEEFLAFFRSRAPVQCPSNHKTVLPSWFGSDESQG